MSPADIDLRGPFILPHGLPDQAAITWGIALQDLCNSQTLHELEEHYRYCCGFVQALQDTQAVVPTVYMYLLVQVQELWIDKAGALKAWNP